MTGTRRSLALLAAIAAGAGVWLGGQALTPPGGPGPSAPTSWVASFNQRIGAVTPQTSDYSFSQIAGSAAPGQLPNLSAMNGLLGFSQINQSGATAGQVPCWTGSGWSLCTLPQIGGALNLTQLAQNGASSGNAPIWSGSSWAPGTPSGGGGGGAVSSVFGRTGSVGAQSGDYSYAQISGTPLFVDQITPTGTIDGTNNVFTIPDTPASGSLEVWVNGLLTEIGSSPADYTLSGSTILFNTPSIPQPGDTLLASYRH